MVEYGVNIPCSAAGYSSAGGLVCRIKGHEGDLAASYNAKSETVTCHVPEGIDTNATCEVYSLKEPLLPPCCTSDGKDDGPPGQIVLSLGDDVPGGEEEKQEVKDKGLTFSGLKPFIIISVGGVGVGGSM